jgi:hypothetical protein
MVSRKSTHALAQGSAHAIYDERDMRIHIKRCLRRNTLRTMSWEAGVEYLEQLEARNPRRQEGEVVSKPFTCMAEVEEWFLVDIFRESTNNTGTIAPAEVTPFRE